MATETTTPLDPNAAYTKKLDKFAEISLESQKISSQEFDKQVVYIAGGALALTIGFLKDILAFAPKDYLFLLFSSWVFFGLALFFNLFSHKKGVEAYDNSLSLVNYYQDQHSIGEHHDPKIADMYQGKMERASDWIDRLNWICLITIALGIVCFISFAYLTFTNMAKQTTNTEINKAHEPDLIKGLPVPQTLRNVQPPVQPASAQPASAPASTEKK